MGRPRSARAKAAAAKTVVRVAKGTTNHAVPRQSSAPEADFTALVSALTPLLSSPAAFLSPSPALRSSLLSQLQSLYAAQLSTSAVGQLLPASALLSILPTLSTTGFTVDQVYEQWQLLQRPLTAHIKHAVSDIVQHHKLLWDEQAAEGRAEVEAEDENGMDDDNIEGEGKGEGEDDDEDDGAEAEENLDEAEAEMEARLDAIQRHGEEEDEEEEGEEEGDEDEQLDDEEEHKEAEHTNGEEDDSQRGEQKSAKQQPVAANKRAKRTGPSTSATREVGEDAFFSLDQMESFADHYEDINNTQPAATDDDTDIADADADHGGVEWDDEVDLDADVGEVDLGGGEHYDDFFDPPTAEELKGQSISDMHRQEDEDDGVVAVKGARGSGEAEEAEEAEQGELEMDGDGEGVAAVEGDEFGGFFARLASHHRAQHKKAQQHNPATSAQPSADSTTTAPAAPLSQFAQQQKALSSTLQQLEQQLITPKPWFHRGEVSAMERPTDSLLTADLQVESNVKQREVMTRAINESIEEIIRRRVSEGRFDDPVKRTANKAKPYRVKESAEVSSEKSTLGLSELYEKEYMEQKEREDATADASAANGTTKQHKSKQQQERDKQVTEIRTLFASLVGRPFRPVAVLVHAGRASRGAHCARQGRE